MNQEHDDLERKEVHVCEEIAIHMDELSVCAGNRFYMHKVGVVSG